MNWFLTNNNDEITIVRDNPDIQDHPDKYVQAEILFESDKKALLSKSKGDYYLLVKNDPEEALKYYLPALADTSDGNGILKRELLEVIPICLSKIGDNDQALEYLQKRLSDSTNNDQKTSVYHCMITWLDKNVLQLEDVIDILSLHSDDPNVWSKLIKLIDVESDQYVGFVLTIVRLCSWLMRHSENEICEYYGKLKGEYAKILDEWEENSEFEERKIRIKKILHDNWSKWPDMKAWLLEGKSRI